jgi:uncharacterized protein YggU (UPF0235/DUF167 family)
MDASAPSPFAAVANGVRIRVRVQPRARRNRVEGLVPEVDGGLALKVAVTAAPEDGRANAAVLALLAEAWGVAKSTLGVTAGAADRRKTILLAGEPGRLMRSLEGWMAELRTSR